jgi:CubicO group peptidase (beta-lactamase class C family)
MMASATNDLRPSAAGRGLGFGLGFGVVTDLGTRGALGSIGTYSWSGIYGSEFFVDPKEQLVGVLMIQVFPSRAPFAEAFGTLAYQAITRSGPAAGTNKQSRTSPSP